MDAETRLIRLDGSLVTKISANRVQVCGAVQMRNGFEASDKILMRGGKIDGALDMRGASITELDMTASRTTGDILLAECDEGLGKPEEQEDFDPAHKGELQKETERNEHPVNMVPFNATAGVDLKASYIGGDLRLCGGTFANKRERVLSEAVSDVVKVHCDFALDLFHTTVEGTLWLGPEGPSNDNQVTIEGSLELRGAHIRTLVDNKRSWPIKLIESGDRVDEQDDDLPCYIFLDGFTYERFVGRSSIRSEDRLEWLRRQPPEHLDQEFKPQPYEQLAKIYRETGHPIRARSVLRNKEKLRWRRSPHDHWHWFRKFRWNLRNRLYQMTIGLFLGYGYRPGNLILVAAGLLVGTTFYFNYAADNGVMAPVDPKVFLDRELAVCRDGWTNCEHHYMKNEHTTFQPFVFALDVIIPVVPLGQEEAWAPMVKGFWSSGEGFMWTIDRWSTVTLKWVGIVFGWIASLGLIALGGGLFKSD